MNEWKTLVKGLIRFDPRTIAILFLFVFIVWYYLVPKQEMWSFDSIGGEIEFQDVGREYVESLLEEGPPLGEGTDKSLPIEAFNPPDLFDGFIVDLGLGDEYIVLVGNTFEFLHYDFSTGRYALTDVIYEDKNIMTVLLDYGAWIEIGDGEHVIDELAHDLYFYLGSELLQLHETVRMGVANKVITIPHAILLFNKLQQLRIDLKFVYDHLQARFRIAAFHQSRLMIHPRNALMQFLGIIEV